MKKELTKAELEVMQILWTIEEGFVNDIRDQFAEPRPAYNTVSTVVRILEKKGFVGYTAYGKSHRYYPLIAKDEYTRNLMKNVLGNFFDNSITNMVSFLTAKENLSVKEIEDIMEIARNSIGSKQQE